MSKTTKQRNLVKLIIFHNNYTTEVIGKQAELEFVMCGTDVKKISSSAMMPFIIFVKNNLLLRICKKTNFFFIVGEIQFYFVVHRKTDKRKEQKLLSNLLLEKSKSSYSGGID